MLVQPLTEIANHRYFQRHPKIVLLAHMHVWLGRILMTLGMINGGLGFHFAETVPGPQWPSWPPMVYGIIAGLVWIIYIAVVLVWAEFERRRTALEEAPPDEPGPSGDVETGARTGTEGPSAKTKRAYRCSAL